MSAMPQLALTMHEKKSSRRWGFRRASAPSGVTVRLFECLGLCKPYQQKEDTSSGKHGPYMLMQSSLCGRAAGRIGAVRAYHSEG